MIKENMAWVALLVLSIVLVMGGFQGAMGRILACIFVPSEVVENASN